jgi:glycosyltransferase involved in cell wall biosynthesis
MSAHQDFTHTFTVFTPTYNRAHLLPRAYESLKKQTFRDFEWLVVDDGSTDNTSEVVKEWQTAASFPIRYVAKANGGKHTAINLAAKEAHGRLFASLDSDDWYLPHTLERFLYHWDRIPLDAQPGFVGVCALCAYASGEVIGTRFPQDILDSDPIELRYRYKVGGDKNGILRTEVLRQFPFPENVGKFISESIVWNRIAKTYKTRFINEALTVAEYQPCGLSNSGRAIQIQNSRASLLCAKELIGLGNRLPIAPRVRAYANYVRHSLHQGVHLSEITTHAPSKLMLSLCYPLGIYLKMKDAGAARNEHAKANSTPKTA